MKIKVKKLNPNAQIPTYGDEGAAAMDLYACIEDIKADDSNSFALDIYGAKIYTHIGNTITIPPHTTVKIGTGLAFEPPKGYAGFIYARSGLSTKNSLRPANCVGICDESYRGEYIVALHNDSDFLQTIHNGDRIAQLIFMPVERAELVETNKLNYTKRGENGFGSTGR